MRHIIKSFTLCLLVLMIMVHFDPLRVFAEEKEGNVNFIKTKATGFSEIQQLSQTVFQ